MIFGRKRVPWSRILLILTILLLCYWCSQKSILPRQVHQERRILAETTTLRIDPGDEKTLLDESDESVDPSLSITAPTADELTEKPPPLNNTYKGPLPEVFAKKLKDYFFEKEGHFLVPEPALSSGEVHFYMFGRDAESLDLHQSFFTNDRGTFISPSFDCKSNFTETELDTIYERNSVLKDVFLDKKTFKPEYVSPVCSLFKVKMKELDDLSQMEDTSIPLVFNFRDPRGRISKVKEVKSLCTSMQSDLKFIERLSHDIVIRLRFEDLFAKPRNEIQRLLKKLKLGLKDDKWEKDLVLPSGWELDGNSLNKINKWKSKLSLEDIKTIENECREIISKMEYHIVS